MLTPPVRPKKEFSCKKDMKRFLLLLLFASSSVSATDSFGDRKLNGPSRILTSTEEQKYDFDRQTLNISPRPCSDDETTDNNDGTDIDDVSSPHTVWKSDDNLVPVVNRNNDQLKHVLKTKLIPFIQDPEIRRFLNDYCRSGYSSDSSDSISTPNRSSHGRSGWDNRRLPLQVTKKPTAPFTETNASTPEKTIAASVSSVPTGATKPATRTSTISIPITINSPVNGASNITRIEYVFRVSISSSDVNVSSVEPVKMVSTSDDAAKVISIDDQVKVELDESKGAETGVEERSAHSASNTSASQLFSPIQQHQDQMNTSPEIPTASLSSSVIPEDDKRESAAKANSPKTVNSPFQRKNRPHRIASLIKTTPIRILPISNLRRTSPLIIEAKYSSVRISFVNPPTITSVVDTAARNGRCFRGSAFKAPSPRNSNHSRTPSPEPVSPSITPTVTFINSPPNVPFSDPSDTENEKPTTSLVNTTGANISTDNDADDVVEPISTQGDFTTTSAHEPQSPPSEEQSASETNEASPEDLEHMKNILVKMQSVLLVSAGLTFTCILMYSVYYINLIRKIYSKNRVTK